MRKFQRTAISIAAAQVALFCCGAAFAQTTPVAASTDLQKVVISGQRAALASAQKIKQDSDEIVDSIVAEARNMVAEGVKTAKSAWQLAQSRGGGIEVPITREVYAIIYEGKPAKQAVRALMMREAKPEFGEPR